MGFTKVGLWRVVSCWIALATSSLWAAETKQDSVAAPPASEKSSPQKPVEKKTAAAPENRFDPTVAPEGTPKELIAFIKRVLSTSPRDEAMQIKMQQAILKAAEKILAAKPTEEEREFAVQAKMHMLQDEKQVAAFAEELKKDGYGKCARIARGFSLQVGMRRAMRMEDSTQIKKMIADVVAYLAEPSPLPADASLAFAVGQLAERMGDNALAADVYRASAKAFAASKTPSLAEFSTLSEGAVRRLTLPGNAMKIEGRLLDGKKFDWSKYAGKVVLVNFWATWCGPCVADVPSIRRYYDFYRHKGFEVVGVSCDRQAADVERFVREKEIPWAIVFDGDKASPTVAYYGIIGIPTMILVGRDGKVVSINARGPALRAELARLLGPMEEKKNAKDEKKQENGKKRETEKK